MALTEVLLSGAGGSIVGGIVGALVPFFLSVRRERQSFTLSMVAQFDSNAMYQIRSRAHALVREHPFARLDDARISTAPNVDDLWPLIGFYKLISILVKENRLTKRIVVDAFGSTFVWWYYCSFKEQLLPLSEKWDLVPPITRLHDWLKERATEATFKKWEAEGNAARAEMVNKLQPPQSEGGAAGDHAHGQTAG